MNAEKYDAGELPSESQLRLCQEAFKRIFYLLAAQGFDLTHILHAMLTSTLAAITTHGDNVTDEGMAEFMGDLSAYFKSRGARH